MNFNDYATVIFDCDGVVLDSNHLKSTAFRNAVMAYGVDAADALVRYHQENGGISRYRKIDYFLEHIAGGARGPDRTQLLSNFSEEVIKGLLHCDVTPGLEALRSAHAEQTWLIVSGGDQEELREVFQARGLASYFDGGIFGSPDTKETILERELASETIRRPAVFLGDSTYDHRAALSAELDFIFVSGMTEVEDWKSYVRTNHLDSVLRVEQLMDEIAEDGMQSS